jgi:hypothetical protein
MARLKKSDRPVNSDSLGLTVRGCLSLLRRKKEGLWRSICAIGRLLDEAEGLGAGVGFVFGEAAYDALLGEAVGLSQDEVEGWDG